MEIRNLFFRKPRSNQPPALSEQKELSFSEDLEDLKKLLKVYGLSYYETLDGDNGATGSINIGDLTRNKMEAFQQKLDLMIQKYPERIGELREEVIRTSQLEDSTGVRDQNNLIFFASEIRNMFPLG
jgi:hypothetical protein